MDSIELISWPAIFKVVIAGIAVYVVQPALLVGRDTVLWWAIEKWILNHDLDVMIFQAVGAEEHRKQFPIKIHKDHTVDPPEFRHDGVVVTSSHHENVERDIETTNRLLMTLNGKIHARKRRLDWILRHYKQPSEENPIPSWMELERERNRDIAKRIES